MSLPFWDEGLWGDAETDENKITKQQKAQRGTPILGNRVPVEVTQKAIFVTKFKCQLHSHFFSRIFVECLIARNRTHSFSSVQSLKLPKVLILTAKWGQGKKRKIERYKEERGVEREG